MKILLDTHAFLWFLGGSSELSERAKTLIENPKYEKYISIASFWEIAIKSSLGKLTLDVPFAKLKTEVIKNNFQILPITFEDTLHLSALPFHHRDPFDRIIISQAKKNGLALVSRDSSFDPYDVNLLW
ncbi:MAG: type II toxin-antitoxin system VapC family toxin [Prevotellaceae bacterium]|jgi:PIN domain nuclease of toxin-antitoxin system|nr:type II toxin-antitoxin system VapC family toxin [Prevotellaceae bacterium]